MKPDRASRTNRYKAVSVASAVLLVAMILVLPGNVSCRTTSSSGRSTDSLNALAGRTGGQDLAGRQLLGLYSGSFSGDLKAKYPKSEWPWVRNVRLMVQWRQIEWERGKYKWRNLDREINAALSLGINSILLTIGGPTPPFATDKSNPGDPQKGPPKDLKYWRSFLRALAKRYRNVVDYYQIWLEPGWDIDAPPAKDNLVYFSGRADYQYMGVLREGYKAIKSVDPTSYVACGSLMNGLVREPSTFYNYDVLMAGKNQDISMKVEAGREIVAERPMYFNYHGAWTDGTVESGVKKPGKTWYLAEGATHPGFEEWICIQNPGGNDADVTITYMFTGGRTQVQKFKVKAHSRFTVDVNSAVGPNRDVAARVESPNQAIVVERPMYFNYRGAWTGGSVESGVPELSNTWYLAEGATHPGFEQWISLQNPGAKATKVEITYMFPGGGTQKQNLTMPPTSRETVLVNSVVGPNRDVSAKIVASSPIIAERPMYFAYQNKWDGGHTEVGATTPATDWFFSEGTTRNNRYDGQFDEWISIQNPGDRATEVDFTYMFPGGGTQKASLKVPAHARETVLVNDVVGDDKDVSVHIKSKEPIVAERPMYFNYHNAWTGGTVELGCLSAGRKWYFAEGTTREGFEEWLTLQNPQSSSTAVKITFMFGDGSTQEKALLLPPQSRTTVGVNLAVSMGTICDAVAFHPYDYPQWWSWYYNEIVRINEKYGFGGKEVVATEIGWPNGTRAEFSPEGQRQAIGEVGVGGLWGAGCRKIWIFEDVDAEPGTSPNQDYYGLFTFDGRPYPAWNEYRKWQQVLPDYGNKPNRL